MEEDSKLLLCKGQHEKLTQLRKLYNFEMKGCVTFKKLFSMVVSQKVALMYKEFLNQSKMGHSYYDPKPVFYTVGKKSTYFEMTLLISLISTLLIQSVLCQNACYEESSRINFFFFVEGSDNPNANGKYEIEDYTFLDLEPSIFSKYIY